MKQVYSFDCPLVLVGMPGCGKSTIGRRLAQSVYLPFIDSDSEIVSREGMSIAGIFAEKGEAYFRDVEAEVVHLLVKGEPAVIATGGGAMMRGATRECVHKHAFTIWLRAGFETLLERLSRNQDRPLLQVDDKEATLRQLLADREPGYAEVAALTVDTDDLSHPDVVEAILTRLAEYNAGAIL